MRVNYPKTVFAVLLSIYFLWIVYDPMQGSFLDAVDLAVHETGHLLFRLFGEFLMIAGGSLFQVIMPAVFVGYFLTIVITTDHAHHMCYIYHET